MDGHAMDERSKRLKATDHEGVPSTEETAVIETGNNGMASEETEMRITAILEKIDRFTELVSEMLEAGKMMLTELGTYFEEQLIQMHAQKLEKWQEEIKELESLDSSNKVMSVLLQNTRSHLLQNFEDDL